MKDIAVATAVGFILIMLTCAWIGAKAITEVKRALGVL
jgi:hypothetical protein